VRFSEGGGTALFGDELMFFRCDDHIELQSQRINQANRFQEKRKENLSPSMVKIRSEITSYQGEK